MLKHLFNITLRAALKRKGLMLLNLAGLSIGMLSFISIYYYVYHEQSFDQFHSNNDRLYRVVMTRYINDELVSIRPDTYPALASVLTNDYPDIESVEKVMYASRGGTLIKFAAEQEVLRNDLKTLYASPQFFGLFDLDVLEGDFSRLNEPFTGMISSELAMAVFGTPDAVGKTWTEDDGRIYQIIGVFEKWKGNSHLNFDLVTSFQSIGARHNSDLHEVSWDWGRMKTYVLLNRKADPDKVTSLIKNVIAEHKPQKTGINLREELSLQPVRDIRLRSDFEADGFAEKSITRVYGLFIIGVVILLLAWVNFINFSLAESLERVKATGIQRSIGATKIYFLKLQLIKALLFNAFSLILALSLWQLLRPEINKISKISYDFHPSADFYLLFIAVAIVGSLITVFVPLALYNRVRITNALKGKLNNNVSAFSQLKKGLTVFQWSVSISLLIAVYVIQVQSRYVTNIDRGVKTSGILVVRQPRSFDYDEFSKDPDVIKNLWKSIPGITGVASSYQIPGMRPSAYEIRELGTPPSRNVLIPEHQVDLNFIELYQHKFVAGRNFSPDLKTDENAAILNVEAAKALFGEMPLEQIIGKQITSPEDEYIRTVIGVVENYFQLSPQFDYSPVNFVLDPESRGYYSITYNSDNLVTLRESIESKFNEVFPGNIFHSFFLDDYYNLQFEREQHTRSLIGFFAAVAVFLSLTGITVMTLLNLLASMKNLSIRKVLGASFDQLYLKIISGNVLRFLLSAVIAIPLTYMLLEQWLQGYSNRINLGFLDFVGPLILLLVIIALSLLSVSQKLLKQNPIQHLKEE